MYLGFVFIRYGKMTDMEKTVFERRVYYLQLPRGRSTASHAGPHGEAPGLVRRQRSEKKTGARDHCGFCRKEWAKQGRQAEQV